MTWPHRAKETAKGALILVALAAVFLIWVGVLKVLRQTSCDRLDAERISHLEPGHDTRGPGSIYVHRHRPRTAAFSGPGALGGRGSDEEGRLRRAGRVTGRYFPILKISHQMA